MALEPEDPAIRDPLHQARAAIETSNYDQAEHLLDRAEARKLAGIERAEQLLQEAQAALARRRLSAAAIRAEQAELLLIQLRYREAAERFAAAEQTPASRLETRRGYRERQAHALYRQGDERRDNLALVGAIRIYRDLLAAYSRQRGPFLAWARIQGNLGIALATLGERESDSERLQAAHGHIQRAWQVYQDAGLDQYDEYFRQYLERLDRLLEAE